MAKKDKEPKEVEVDSTDKIALLMKEIDKEYGKGIASYTSSILDRDIQNISISPSLDILCGGIPESTLSSISGKEKLGKTTLALTIAAEAQKLGKRVFYGNVEHRLKKKNLLGIEGLNSEPPNFVIIQSSEDKILSSVDFLNIFLNILKREKGCVLIIDSISSLCSASEMLGGVGTESRGRGQHYITQFCDQVAPVIHINKSMVIGICHIYANTSGFGASQVEKSAASWKYQSDVRLKAVSQTPWKNTAGTQIGQITNWFCEESALGPKGMKIDSYIRYGIGIDKLYEVIEFAKSAGLIEKAGAWLTLSYLENHLELIPATEWSEEVQKSVKYQGQENLYEGLKENPKWEACLREEVMKIAGNFVTTGAEND